MDHDVLKSRWPIAALLLTTAFASATVSAQGVRGQDAASASDVEVFVQLNTPSVAEFNAASLSAGRGMPDGAAQRAQAARVSAEQEQFRSLLASYGATELSTQRVGANGFRVRVSPEAIANLRSLSGVRTVGRVETHTMDNAQSVPWIGAAQFWATYGKTGEDVTIGVIDSGIDYTHAGFGGPGTTAAYLANNKNIVEAGTFPTAKVVGGYDFAGPTYNANIAGSVPTPDADPIDGNGHGSHVAGTAAGLGVPGVVGSGVAPGAKLYALKVFNDTTGSTNVTSLAIEWAMDPNADGDMSDHLDVINMSLGSPLGEPNDPSAISTNNAAAVGIIVATSAGNEGDVPYVTGAPGVAASAISTAATTPGGRLYSRFTVNTPASVAGVKPSLEGSGLVQLSATGPISGNLIPASPINGCAPLANAAAVSGNIAFIVRGVCGFLVKYQNAQNAGARAIVVFNDGATPARVEPLVMGGLDATITIPGLMISSTSGNAILAAGPATVTLDAIPNPALADQIATFSSRGPGHGGSTFKPDLSAPGVAIVSVGVGSGTGAANLQGTSMASPHVAGAAALLRQLHPELDQSAIKALLMNSTVDANVSGDTDVARQGVGSVRVDAAAALSSYATPAGITFGRVNPVSQVNLSETAQVVNLGKKSRTYSVTHTPGQTYPGVAVTCPASVSVQAGSFKRFSVRLRFDPAVAFAQGQYDVASITQTEVDGWCVLSDGTDTLRVAYIAVVDPASRTRASVLGKQVIRLRNTGPSASWADAFTFSTHGADTGDEKPHSIKSVGYRTIAAAPDNGYFGDPVMEFAVQLKGGWEHISNLNFDFYLDTNGDGLEDTRLRASDLSTFQDVDPGTYVTGQFPYANGVTSPGNLDWLVTGWDFNDEVVIIPFTRVGGFLGRVPDVFSYRLVVTGRDDSTDTRSSSINVAQEVRVSSSSVFLTPNSSVDVNVMQGEGAVLWLLPNDAEDQTQLSDRLRAPGTL